MLTLSRRYYLLVFVALTFGLVLTEWLVTQSQSFARRPDLLSLAITVDLAVGLPLLYYRFIVRTGRWSKASLVAVFGAALGLAKWLLPPANETYVNGLARALPLLEVGVLVYVSFHGTNLLRAYRAQRPNSLDFAHALQQSLEQVTGRPTLSRIITTEAAVVRYGLFGWINEPEPPVSQATFTTHRESGQIALLIGLVLIGLVEAVVVHLLAARWSGGVAWLLTAVSLYGLLFIIAEAVLTVRHPIRVDTDTLHLRFGLRWRIAIALADIECAELIHERPAGHPQTLVGNLLTTPNVLLTLRRPVAVDGIYGIRKTIRQIALVVDERDRFVQSVRTTRDHTAP